jgi:hypothetical protein
MTGGGNSSARGAWPWAAPLRECTGGEGSAGRRTKTPAGVHLHCSCNPKATLSGVSNALMHAFSVREARGVAGTA